jgi:hypothetical protein
MTKRLQVLLEDDELESIRQAARRERLSVAGWVRRALRTAREREAGRDPREKLDALNTALRHDFPTGDVEQMLSEIERGYGR